MPPRFGRGPGFGRGPRMGPHMGFPMGFMFPIMAGIGAGVTYGLMANDYPSYNKVAEKDSLNETVRKNLRLLEPNDNSKVPNSTVPSNLLLNYDFLFEKNSENQVVDIKNDYIKELFYSLINTYNDIIKDINRDRNIMNEFSNRNYDKNYIFSEIEKKIKEKYEDISIYGKDVPAENISDFFKFCFDSQIKERNNFFESLNEKNVDTNLIQIELSEMDRNFLNSDISKCEIVNKFLQKKIEEKSQYISEKSDESVKMVDIYKEKIETNKIIENYLSSFINECNNLGISPYLDESEENVKHVFKETLYMNNTIPYLKLNWDEDESLLKLFDTIIGTKNSYDANAIKSYFNNPVNENNALYSIGNVSRQYINKCVMNNGLLNKDTESHFHSNLRYFANQMKEWAKNNLWTRELYTKLDSSNRGSPDYMKAFEDFKDFFKNQARTVFFDVEDFCRKLSSTDINMLREATEHDLNKHSENSWYTTGGTVLGEEIELLLAKNSPYYGRLLNTAKRGRMLYIEELRKNLRKFSVVTPVYDKNNNHIKNNYTFSSYNGALNEGVRYMLDANNIVNEKIKDQERLSKLAGNTAKIMGMLRKIHYRLMSKRKSCVNNYERQLEYLKKNFSNDKEKIFLCKDDFANKLGYIDNVLARFNELYKYYDDLSQEINKEGLKLSKNFCCITRNKKFIKLTHTAEKEYKGFLKNSVTYKNNINFFKKAKEQKIDELKNYFTNCGILVNEIEEKENYIDKLNSLRMRLRKSFKISVDDDELQNDKKVNPEKFKKLYNVLDLERESFEDFYTQGNDLTVGKIMNKINEKVNNLKIRINELKSAKNTDYNLDYNRYEKESKYVNDYFDKILNKLEYDFYKNNTVDRNAIFNRLNTDLDLRLTVLENYKDKNKNVKGVDNEYRHLKNIKTIINDEKRNKKKDKMSIHDVSYRDYVKNKNIEKRPIFINK